MDCRSGGLALTERVSCGAKPFVFQETYAFFDGLNGYYMPGSLRILVESAREHFDKVLQKAFPFIRSAFPTSDSSSTDHRSPSNKQERERQPHHAPALPSPSSELPVRCDYCIILLLWRG
jgi:hypothetical protein